MKSIKLKSTIFCLFVCVAFSLFFTSCSKDSLENPEELLSLNENVQKIHANDPEVQEFLRVQSGFMNHFNSLSPTQIDRFNIALESKGYPTEELLSLLGFTLDGLNTSADKLNSSKIKLQEKYPELGFNEMDTFEFIQKMNDLFPENITAKRNSLQNCLDLALQSRIFGLYDCLENYPVYDFGFGPGVGGIPWHPDLPACIGGIDAVYSFNVWLCNYNHG